MRYELSSFRIFESKQRLVLDESYGAGTRYVHLSQIAVCCALVNKLVAYARSDTMKDEELKAFLSMQNALALVAYVNSHNLGIHPMSFLKRKDEVACSIRHDAGMEWAAMRADRFRAYWEANRDSLLTMHNIGESDYASLLQEF